MNPWKNRAELYFKTTLVNNKVSISEFSKFIESKKEETDSLLLSYESSPTPSSKHYLAKTFKDMARVFNYKSNYVAVNEHSGSDLKPVFNNLVLVAEIRSFQIQQVEYADRCAVRNNINRISRSGDFNEEIKNFLIKFNSIPHFVDRMKLLCNYQFSDLENIIIVLNNIPLEYSNYYNALGPAKILSLSCQRSKLENELKGKAITPNLENEVYNHFEEGQKYTLKYIK